jgi:glycine dehydrogenase subunit 1
MTEHATAHPYIPNSSPQVRAAMREAVGVATDDDLFASIPARLRAPADLGLPPALASEPELRRYFDDVLARNADTAGHLSFLGGGCWSHAVPAVCDEIASRGEFTSAFMGLAGASTTGAYQALFEYQSLIAELVGLDVAPLPAYDWAWAASTALLMAVRATGRRRVLVADTAGPERRRQIATRLPLRVDVEWVGHDPATGAIDLDDVAAKADGAAALYFENPSYLGLLEPELDGLRQVTADHGCRLVAGVDPMSLGVVRDPGSYGADLACGELQPLGQHQTYGGSSAGFMACRLDEALLAELPNIFISAVPTVRAGELDFFWGNFESTSYATRGESDDVIGCGSTMAGIVAATYLTLLGPVGMAELGAALRDRAQYLATRLAAVDGVDTERLRGLPFKELVVDFSPAGHTPAGVNAALLPHGILGGLDLGHDFPELAGCALYSVSELHTREDLDRLASTIEEVLR